MLFLLCLNKSVHLLVWFIEYSLLLVELIKKSASSTIDCQYAHSKGAKVQLEADVGIQRCCKAGCIDFRKPNTFGRRSHALLHGVVR